VGTRPWQDLAIGWPDVSLTPEAILSLIATVGVGIAFLLMLQEAIALRHGNDPINNGVRSFVRRFPRGTYVLAVLIGMVLGHLLWP
jgi:VIT1/CCC1 family predicted Fe2+/Mn2+ transporter